MLPLYSCYIKIIFLHADSLVDTSDVPTCFKMKLSAEQWALVIEKIVTIIDDEQLIWFKACSQTYGNCLAAAFNEFNKCCCLSFNQATVRKPHQVSHAFLRVYGKCKGPECHATYALTVHEKPTEDAREVVVNVRKTNKEELKHYQSDHIKRPLKGQERELVKKELVTKKPSKLIREKFAIADSEQLDMGNYNIVKTLKVYQQARSEVSHYFKCSSYLVSKRISFNLFINFRSLDRMICMTIF